MRMKMSFRGTEALMCINVPPTFIEAECLKISKAKGGAIALLN
jgi:hypothetical protein